VGVKTMQRPGSFLILGLVLAALLTACAPPRGTPAPGETGRQGAARKQIVASIFSSPAGLHQELTNPQGTSGSVPGLGDVYQLLGGGLTYLDGQAARHPWLAEAVPSVENGLWRVAPDGRMETTWRIKPGARWHDGKPFTSDDLRFTFDVYRDRELGISAVPGLQLVDGAELPDAQTAILKWREPFISADTLFSSGPTMWLLPRHLLEAPLQENREHFLGLMYWQSDFVGVGPFKVQEWVPGSSLTLIANEDYILGRPKLDQIDVRFFTDRGPIVAGLLAGALNVHIGRGLNPLDIIQLKDRTQEVKVQLGGPLGNVLPIYPQSISPDPPIVSNLQFRRAMLQAINRQELTDTLNNGLGPVAHSWVPSDLPEGRAVEPRIVRYDHDPRAAARVIESLGFTRDAEGNLRGADGTRLIIPLVTHRQNAFHEPATLSVARYWKELGMEVVVDVLPVERAGDLEYRALFPGFFLISRGLPVDRPDNYFTRRAVPIADNGYRGGNVGRYSSPEIDALVQKYMTTIPFPERMHALGDMVQIQTEQLTMLPLFFQGAAFILGTSRLQGVLGGQVWNAHLWDLS
jgi:peptide/nickel transport system substrate-binding protein